MQSARRRHYIREGDWVDSLYKTYVTVIAALVALFYLGAAFGSADASAATVRDVEAHAPAVLGLVVAVFAALGLRSGARGGPLAVAAPDVTYLLLAPVPRSVALRATAWRQLRGVLLLPTIAGGVAANIVANHFGGEQVFWIVAGAAFGALAALLTWGAALVASGRRWSSRRAQLVGAALVVWAGIDVALATGTSPMTQIGRVALGPLSWSWSALIGIVLPVVLAGWGLAGIGGASVEPLRRRAQLVRELRFAATLQDLRSVIVLHRELAQELPRSRPWWRVGGGLRAGPSRRRDWQGYARWPLVRVVRVVVLASVAGAALIGVWRVNDAFVVVAGLALFFAGVDTVEGLAQEHDHPNRAELIPVAWGRLVLDHIVAPACALALVGIVGIVVFFAAVESTDALLVGVIVLVPAALATAVGAATSVVAGAPSPTLYVDFPFPEFGALWLIVRQLLPPRIAITAMVPVAVAHDALGHESSAAGAALGATLLPLGLVAITGRWLQTRSRVT